MNPNVDVQKTMEALRENNMLATYVETRADAKALVEELIPACASVAYGGSVTLSDCGIDTLLRSGNYAFHDRFEPDASPERLDEIFKEIKTCDYFLMSSNAIIQDGRLYNVDGMGNRISCLIHGPKHVLVVAGLNKLVPTLDDAIQRVREVAAPLNNKRLDTGTPCVSAGVCCDCDSPGRICCSYLVSAYQRIAGRVHVILVNEQLGY